MTFLVTVKLPRRDDHDPAHKVTGRCPVPPHFHCTDVTGQHHTVLVTAESAEGAAARFPGWHITRVEAAATI